MSMKPGTDYRRETVSLQRYYRNWIPKKIVDLVRSIQLAPFSKKAEKMKKRLKFCKPNLRVSTCMWTSESQLELRKT